MEQKRYESDMTPKEKRELERKKLKQMTAGQKLEYIWAYYKPDETTLYRALSGRGEL